MVAEYHNAVCWVDSHCHPHLAALGKDHEHLAQAIAYGMRMMCVSVELSDYEKLASYKKMYPQNVCFSLGSHPLHDMKTIDWDKFAKQVAEDKNIIAIGETGFDFQGDLEVQRAAFKQHAEIACRHNLPIILHIRGKPGGESEVEQITKQTIAEITNIHKNFKGVFHCFTGSLDLAEFAIKMGWMVSFSGIITFKNAHHVRDVALHLYNAGHIDYILIETDSPYLAPQEVRGKENVPSYVAYVGQFMADLFKMPVEDFAKKMANNFDRLFVPR